MWPPKVEGLPFIPGHIWWEIRCWLEYQSEELARAWTLPGQGISVVVVVGDEVTMTVVDDNKHGTRE